MLNNSDVELKTIQLNNITKIAGSIQEFNDLQLAEMTYKIKNNLGVDPIIVTIDTTEKEEKYIIISGYLQFLAYSKTSRNNSEFSKVKCVVIKSNNLNSKDVAELAGRVPVDNLSKDKRKALVIKRIEEYKFLKKENRIPRTNINKLVAKEFGLNERTINLYVQENKINKVRGSFLEEHEQYFASKEKSKLITQNDVFDMIIEDKRLRSAFIRNLYFAETLDANAKFLFKAYPRIVSYYRNSTKTFPDRLSRSFIIDFFENMGYLYKKRNE